MDLTPIGSAAKADHDAIVRGVLRSGTIVRLEVETPTPTVRRFTIERSVPNPPVVKDASGTVTNLQPADVIGHIEIFGQHELAELSGDNDKVANMLGRFQGAAGLTDDHEATLRKLREIREKLKRADDDRARLEEELAEIPRLQDQVTHYQETDVPTRLKEVTRIAQDEALFIEGRQRVVAAETSITGLTDTQLVAQLNAGYDGIDESPQAETLRRVTAATTALADTLKSLATAAQEATTATLAEIDSAATEWEAAVREQRAEHAGVLRKLVEDGLDPDKYLTTTRALEDLKGVCDTFVGDPSGSP